MQWFFGNGDSSTLRNPSIDFTSIDEFDISLTVTDNNGCVSSITENDYIITDRIYPLFSVSDSIVCESEVVSFMICQYHRILSYLISGNLGMEIILFYQILIISL